MHWTTMRGHIPLWVWAVNGVWWWYIPMGDNTSVAPSFRSSAPTSPGERPSPGSISLEFEDYPLDLVSSTRGAKPEPRGANGGRLSWHGANQYDYAYGAKRGFFENRYVENDIEPVRPLTNGNVCSYLDDLREFPRYKKERKLCSSCQMCCLRACSEDQPAPKRSPLPAWRQYIRDLFRWPPQGPMAQSITLLLGALLCWAILWSLYREKAAPGGGLFALLILVVLGHIAGQLLQCFRLPPLLGKNPCCENPLVKLIYHKTSNMRHTKSQNFTVSPFFLQLPLHNPLKPGVKSRMKM